MTKALYQRYCGFTVCSECCCALWWEQRDVWYWDAYGNVMMKMDVCLSKCTCGEFSMEELMSKHK